MSTGATSVLLSGWVFIALYGAGNTEGVLQGPIEVEKFTITPASDTKERISRAPGSYGQVKASVQLPKPTELAITFGDVSRATLAMALLGEQVVNTQAAGTVNNQNLDVTAKGVWFPLGKKSVSAVVVTNDHDDVTYVEGVDYEVNKRLGLIKILPESTISVSSGDTHVVLHIDYAYAAIDGVTINGGVVNQVKAKLIFDGVNLVDDTPMSVEVDLAVLAPSGGWDVMTADFGNVPLQGKIVTLPNKTEGYRVTMQ